MNRIGLALSGGGFRATIYHIGVLRFLYDAGLLQRVSHVTSVSGGSIMAAHLVMNWHRYTGSEQDFEQATNELLDFVRLDVRNRVVRRYPLAFAANCVRRFFRQGWSRRLTRAGLLESLYEKHLYGDKCLYELPTMPQLHMLATNVNEGCLCSFTRKGILVESRMPNGATYFNTVPSALATVPMAVAASSAFPGFFPPLLLTAKDVGADEGRFPPHVLTDGGVYDNLGVRMFQHIRESWIGHDTPLGDNDFINLREAVSVLNAADKDAEQPLGRLAALVRKRCQNGRQQASGISEEDLPAGLWNVIVYDQLYRDECLQNLAMDSEEATDMLNLARHGRRLDRGEHLWLNRNIANAAYGTAGKGALLRSTQTDFDTVIVSDAGREFYVSRQTTGGGLIATGMRASDILMDRVWKLELDHFHADKGFVFAPITSIVHQADDPTALHPEIQRQVAVMRTDLDKFTDLEISGLVRHGYGVMRQACRSRHDLFGDDLPSAAPWDPTSIDRSPARRSSRGTSQITTQARDLQQSAQRQILGKLLSLKDWPTYVYVPLLLLLLVGGPIVAYRTYKTSHRSEMIVDAITYSNPDFQLVLQLARENPIPGEWTALDIQEVPELKPHPVDGFRMITDTRVIDMRAWRRDAEDQSRQVTSYRRMQVRRVDSPAGDASGGTVETDNKFRLQQFLLTRDASIRCESRSLKPVLRMAPHTNPSGQNGYLFELEFDLSSVPEGQDFDINFEGTEPGVQGRTNGGDKLIFPIIAPTDVASMWVLLPEDYPYRSFEVVGYDAQDPVNVKAIEPTYDFQMADGSLFGWMLVAPQDGFVYECHWTWLYD